MTIFYADCFPQFRGGVIAAPYTWNVSNIRVDPCPTGWGWALTREGTLSGNATITATFPATVTGDTLGVSVICSLNRDPSITAWVDILSYRRASSTDRNSLQYQASTNRWRFTRDLSTVALGAEFNGPADPSIPFELVFEFFRDSTLGWCRAWFDTVKAGEVLNTNTGLFNGPTWTIVMGLPGNLTISGDSTISNLVAWDAEITPYTGQRRVVEYLPPIGDFQRQWHTPSTGLHYPRLADANSAGTQVNGSAGQTNIYDMQNMRDIPDALEAVFHHYNQVFQPVDYQYIEPDGTQVFNQPTAGHRYFRIPTAYNGQPWTPERLHALKIGTSAPAGLSGNVSLVVMHLLAVRSIEGTPIEVPSVGRAYIISS